MNHPALSEIISRLRKSFAPEQIILFGSYAWGSPNPDSDLDILVILDHSTQLPHIRQQQALRCLRGLRVAKDVLVKTRAEFEFFRQVPASLEYQIAAQGKILYERSTTAMG